VKNPKPKTYVMLLEETLDTPAWRALSHGACRLYIALKRRWRKDNNGSIFLSQRDAARELGSNRSYVGHWFCELQHYGFIVMTRQGSIGTDGKGRASHWRLTELPYMDEEPTRDFTAWNGVKFSAKSSPKKKKKPGPITGATPGPTTGARGGLKVVP
jgi:hypothetical protein